jgi:cell division protein FtsQ
MTRRPAAELAPRRRHPARRPARSTVSATSAQRFAARVRARRRRRLLIGAAACLLLAGTGWALLAAPWSTVRRIEVFGVHRVDAAAVRAAAQPEVGRPLVLVDTGRIAAEIRREPLVAAVAVSRRWPGTLLVMVRERAAVAAVPAASGVNLVDADGVVVGRATVPPRGLPVIHVALGRAQPPPAPGPAGGSGTPALRACLDVLSGLPAGLRDQVRQIGAGSPLDVWMVLNDGSRVRWGGSEQTARKAEVLLALRRQRAARYDVSAPDAPAVAGLLR